VLRKKIRTNNWAAANGDVGSTIMLSDPSPLVTFTMRKAGERVSSGSSAVVSAAVPNTFVSYVAASIARVLRVSSLSDTAALFCAVA
jgi:hypothetical protein